MFKANKIDTRTTPLNIALVPLLITLNIFYTFFSCFYCYHGILLYIVLYCHVVLLTGKCLLGTRHNCFYMSWLQVRWVKKFKKKNKTPGSTLANAVPLVLKQISYFLSLIKLVLAYINPFVANVPILHPWKHQAIKGFLVFSGGRG